MNVGPESHEVDHLRRLLVVSATPWVQTAAHALEDADEAESITVDVVESDRDFDIDSLATDGSRAEERPDCVLTDDTDVVRTGDIDDPLPLVFAVESPTSDALESISGDVEVVTRTDATTPALFRHRLERAVERAHARRTLADREAWYRTLTERSSTLLLVLDEERRRRFVSPSVQRIVGCDPSGMLGERADEVIHPDDRATFVEAFDEVSERGPGATATCSYRIRHADDSWHVHEASLTNHLEDPTVGGVVVSIHDVTDYRRGNRDLDEPFERVSDAFVALDAEWRFTYVNDRAEELFEADADDLVGRSLDDVVPELEGTELRTKAREAFDTQEPGTIDTYVEPYDLWVEARFYPSPTGLSVSVTDTTAETVRNVTPAERDRTERLQTLLENVPVDLFVLDSDGTFTLSGGSGLENIGLESGDVVGESIFDVADDPQIHADVRRALDGEPVHTRQSIEDRFFESWYQPVTEDEVECVVGVGVDVTERSRYERALETIQEATTKQLLTVESSADALEYVVDVATDVLEGTDVVCYRFDERANELVPAAYSTAERPVGVRPTESPIWDVFVRETPQTFDEVDFDVDVDIVPSADEGRNGSTALRSGLSVSLGEHGVLVVASPDPDRYVSGAEAVDLAQLLAATAEAALDRIERSQRLRERERELDEQNTRLERLGRASRVREDLEELLLRADSREEIERGICDRLLEIDECQFAWIGEPDPGGNRVVPRETAGHGDSYLEAVTVTTVDDPATEPTGACVRSREVVSVENVADGIRNGAWRAEALSRNFQSILSIPLLYDGFLYGVLSVYADRHDGFDEPTRTILEELGETIAYTIDAVQRKNALVSDDVTELELEFEAESAFTTLAERFETTVTLEGTIPQTDDSTITFLALETSVDSDDIGELDGFESVTPLRVSDDRTLVQARLTGPFFGTTVENYGGSLRALTIDESGTRAIVDVPRSVEVRELLAGISRSGPDVSLRAKHDRTRSRDRDRDHGRVLENHGQHPLLEELTDRQREVVQAAYHGGFFEWPRTATGEEVAASLGISPPAFHNHVRSVQRKVFASLFETGPLEEH